jgi:gamma-D-glutamyl-L-lysine dipeptidyl-peptidase
MDYAICTVPAAAVRKEPSHRSEMVNQLLFGETMEVLEEKEEWFRIRSSYDRYEGWLTWHLIAPIAEKLIKPEVQFIAKGIVNPLTLPESLVNIPMGAQLTGFDEETRLLWDERYKYHGTYRRSNRPFDNDLLVQLVHSWMNAPYLWGGKTFMGVDCSGFVQTVFKVMGIHLSRDAYQQANEGNPVASIAEAIQGDVAFFQNEQGKVTHVGIVLDGGKIIHASGRVRIDSFDEKGIMNLEVNKRTHHHHSIRRYF